MVRKFVGTSPSSATRRDYVRLNAPLENNTCLSAQIQMFIKATGFSNDSIVLPCEYRNPIRNDSSVVFALVRWMSPHPDAILRDLQSRPVCTSPLDINHALWTFTESRRHLLTRRAVQDNLSLYHGVTREERVSNSDLEQHATYEFMQPESFERYMNCTRLTEDPNTILETIVIPF